MQKLKKINVLVFGSGAREHAIADAIFKSPLLGKLYLAQSGVFNIGEIIDFKDYEDLAKKALKLKINLAIIGPEEPICKGIADIFKKYKIPCIGVNKTFSQLESSKIFGKKFMGKYGIKTAKYSVINESAKVSYLHSLFDNYGYPLVIKADGLCKGKGVKIVYDKISALTTIVQYLNGKFGESSKNILLEEFLQGEEFSLMSLWDGQSLLHLPPARDFKKLNDSFDSPNTGGMGAFCPVGLTKEQQEKLEVYKKQLQNALKKEKADFTGFIYSGLIWAEKYKDWYVLEYNVRLGDPETQAILTHLESDFLEILQVALNKQLNKIVLKYKKDYSACLVIACEGYPDNPKDGEEISIPDVHHCEPIYRRGNPKEDGLLRQNSVSSRNDIKIFNAGVEKIDEKLYSKSGRVLSLCTTSKNPFPALKAFAEKIKMNNKYYRKDIEI